MADAACDEVALAIEDANGGGEDGACIPSLRELLEYSCCSIEELRKEVVERTGD